MILAFNFIKDTTPKGLILKLPKLQNKIQQLWLKNIVYKTAY